MSDTEKIRELLHQRPGLKAQQIATELGLDRPQVAEALHTLAATDVVQDNSYRWWPKNPPSAAAPEPPKSLLGRVCRYYLDCLARESGSAISLPAAAQDSEYVPLAELPFAADKPPALSRAARRIIRKVRQERGQLTLYIGYAVRLRSAHIRDGDELRIEPVLIYPIDEAQDDSTATLRPAGGIPLFNLEALKSLLSVDSGNVTDEAIQLAEELGLANAEEDLPPWDEIILRLRLCRPEWDWREDLNPYKLSPDPPLAQLTRPGIYNRAILFAGTRSPFTYGLELELRKLAQMEEDRLAPSALGLWLRGGSIDTAPVEDQPILELLPLNTEQRQAVVQGLTAPLTVVTGPPGTGKSQVVIALAANMAWRGRSVLFASKNNHAVDVVESRANELAPYPLLLRLGREEHHDRLAQHLTSVLAESSNPDDAAAYAWLERAHQESRTAFAGVQRAIAHVVELRNRVDELERAAEPARAALGPERFAALRDTDSSEGRGRLALFGAALESSANRERRERETKARAYWQAFDQLRAARPLEQLAQDLARISSESAHNSLELWRRWLRLWPSRWNREQRALLSEFVSLFQMIGTGDRHDQIAGKRVFRRYYSLFPEITRMLPCWAITSLSARGRLPFDPALFDLVIIDEASQCDIASALPLLLRARRAVIIGDPLQLKHVSTVGPQEDRLMLAAHGLAEGKAAWAYSVNSLFDLARTFCRHEDIVNLRDHHRSHRDIIAFSNRYFYRGGLRVATGHDALKRAAPNRPAVEWLDVKGRVMRPSRGGAVNPAEAQAVVAEIRKLVTEENYQGSLGVVTPFRAQANRIRTLAHQDAELSGCLASLHFVVDTVHGFQGDERDVIFFSPVVSQGTGESTLRFLKGHGNLFNVAITRARSELIVIGDRQAALDSGVSYLASFAEYVHALRTEATASAPARELGPEYPAVAHPETVSQWERLFYKALYAAGLRPVPQYDEAPYTLDFALFAGARKLDIEIDGEHYHRNWDGELCRRDQIRSRRLSDLGWEIMRFWVYELRENLEDCVERVRGWMGT